MADHNTDIERKAALRSIWRGLAEKGIDGGADWPHIARTLFRDLDDADRRQEEILTAAKREKAAHTDAALAEVERQIANLTSPIFDPTTRSAAADVVARMRRSIRAAEEADDA